MTGRGIGSRTLGQSLSSQPGMHGGGMLGENRLPALLSRPHLDVGPAPTGPGLSPGHVLADQPRVSASVRPLPASWEKPESQEGASWPHPTRGTKQALRWGGTHSYSRCGGQSQSCSRKRLAGLWGGEGLPRGRANDYLPGLEMKGLTTLPGSLAPDTCPWARPAGWAGPLNPHSEASLLPSC